ncbi:unnamed protein product [Rhizophagus irregularis]|nr:unnamed protein product [Rhizophagus irregularis]
MNAQEYINSIYLTKELREKETKLDIKDINLIEYLDLFDNLFSQNLSCFSHFVGLEELHIGKNKFNGSLEYLKNLVKLESLNISNTDIDSGLEYLPDSVKSFLCLTNERPEAKVKKIHEQLEIYAMSDNDAHEGRYNLRVWKLNWKLVKDKEALQCQIRLNDKFTELEEEEDSLHAKAEKLTIKNNQLGTEIKDLREFTKDLNSKLKQKDIDYQQILQQLKKKEEELKSSAAEHYIEKEKLQKEVNVLRDELDTKEKEIKQSEELLEKTNKQLRTKEDASASLKNELDIRLLFSNIEVKKRN